MKKTALLMKYEDWQMYQEMIEMGIKAINDNLYEMKQKKKTDYRLKLIGMALVEINIKIKTKLISPRPKFAITFTVVQSLALFTAYLESYIQEYDMYTTSLLKAQIIPTLDKNVA